MIQQARLHDEEALVALYWHTLPIVYRYVLVRLGRIDLTENVVSEVFLDMVKSIGNLRTNEEAGFYVWLFQIVQDNVSRALRSLKRSAKKRLPLLDGFRTNNPLTEELVATDLGNSPAESHEWCEMLEEVGQALGSLSVEQQMIVVGRFLAGQKIEDLARALGKQPGRARVLQFRALKALAKRLGQVRRLQRKDKGGQG